MSTIISTRTPEQILLRLEWDVIRRLDGMLQGDYRTLFYGSGVDFADLREYQPGDDIRYIDWNVTARMDAPYVRQYAEDREVTAWFLLDLSPSVDFGTGQNQTQKRNMLIDFTALLARLLTRSGNRVGAIMFGDKIQHTVPVGGGRLQVLRLVNDLLKQPRLSYSSLTDLRLLFQSSLGSLKQHSLVFVLSDFISQPGWDSALGTLSQKHEVLAIRLWDPREMELPDAGMVMMEDSETGEQLFVDTHDRAFRARFKDIVQKREAELAHIFKHAGVDVLSLSTEDDLVQAVVRFARQRQMRRK
jgi:uncharacterized protein (DUF58 family)